MNAGSTLIPGLRYRDAMAAIHWLESVLGFTRQAVYPGANNTVMHAQLAHGSGMVMLGSASNPNGEHYILPAESGGRVSSALYLVVPDCDPLWARVQERHAEVVQPLRSMDYGGRAFTVRDPEGYHWSVGEYDPWAPDESEAP